jgi:hypothetical protein
VYKYETLNNNNNDKEVGYTLTLSVILDWQHTYNDVALGILVLSCSERMCIMCITEFHNYSSPTFSFFFTIVKTVKYGCQDLIFLHKEWNGKKKKIRKLLIPLKFSRYHNFVRQNVLTKLSFQRHLWAFHSVFVEL